MAWGELDPSFFTFWYSQEECGEEMKRNENEFQRQVSDPLHHEYLSGFRAFGSI